ncbi:hypothetical protein D3C83_53050 [compost metagenome]
MIVGSKPTNQASVYSSIVPVLPPSGQSRLAAAAAVPRSTTPRSKFVITNAVSARMASCASGRRSSSTLPSRSLIVMMPYGVIRTPRLTNAEYALVMSTSVASPAPSAEDRYGGTSASPNCAA